MASLPAMEAGSTGSCGIVYNGRKDKMKIGKFREGTVIKGKDLKGYTLYKILSGDMEMCGIQYKLGLNEDTGLHGIDWANGSGLSFCLARDICCFLPCGEILALVSIPEKEDVYVHRKVIEKTVWMDEILNSGEAWESLMLNGTDITADGNCAVRFVTLVDEYLAEED